jgi:hypothetical protein
MLYHFIIYLNSNKIYWLILPNKKWYYIVITLIYGILPQKSGGVPPQAIRQGAPAGKSVECLDTQIEYISRFVRIKRLPE